MGFDLGGAVKGAISGGASSGSWWGAAAGGLAGGLSGGGSNAPTQSAKAYNRSAKEAIGYQQNALGQAQGNYQPWMTSGVNANTAMSDQLGLNGVDKQQTAFDNYRLSPGQAFLRDQGEKAFLRNKAAIGDVGGNMYAGLQNQAIGQAEGFYNDYWNRLNGVANTGFNATNNLENLRLGYTGNMSNLKVGMGLANASGITGQANTNAAQTNQNIGLGAGLGSMVGDWLGSNNEPTQLNSDDYIANANTNGGLNPTGRVDLYNF